jgi:uncharacterized glyoxalase superfamily protein PhnB
MLQGTAMVRGRDARIGKPPQEQTYGMREFDIVDPDGNMIFFCQEVKKA